jgi:hypothetical protein
MSKRTTITLTAADEQALINVSDPASGTYSVLVDIAARHGIELHPGASEAQVVRALLHAGAAALQEEALNRGYAALAADYDAVHDRAEARARRVRNEQRRSRELPS